MTQQTIPHGRGFCVGDSLPLGTGRRSALATPALCAYANDIKTQSLQPSLTPSAELQLLNVFVGKWPTEGLSYGSGQSYENPYDSPVRWLGAETYEWLPGGFFLVRRFNGQIGDIPISGMETIGYDAASQTYPSQMFDNYGRIHLGQRRFHDGIWSYTGAEYRATYTFRNDGNNLATHWEWLCKDNWSVLMDSEGTKVE